MKFIWWIIHWKSVKFSGLSSSVWNYTADWSLSWESEKQGESRLMIGSIPGRTLIEYSAVWKWYYLWMRVSYLSYTSYRDWILIFHWTYFFIPSMRDQTSLTTGLYFCETSFFITALIHCYSTFSPTLVCNIIYLSVFTMITFVVFYPILISVSQLFPVNTSGQIPSLSFTGSVSISLYSCITRTHNDATRVM